MISKRGMERKEIKKDVFCVFYFKKRETWVRFYGAKFTAMWGMNKINE